MRTTKQSLPGAQFLLLLCAIFWASRVALQVSRCGEQRQPAWCVLRSCCGLTRAYGFSTGTSPSLQTALLYSSKSRPAAVTSPLPCTARASTRSIMWFTTGCALAMHHPMLAFGRSRHAHKTHLLHRASTSGFKIAAPCLLSARHAAKNGWVTPTDRAERPRRFPSTPACPPSRASACGTTWPAFKPIWMRLLGLLRRPFFFFRAPPQA